MIEYGHATHVGLRRDHNEDTYCAWPELGLWLVADGMGGHEQGEVASAMARDFVADAVSAGQPLSEAIWQADQKICNHARAEGGNLPMGTTIAAVKIDDESFDLAWVGDSRVYVWNGTLKQLSNDHSYVQELVSQGAISADQARTHPHRNVVTQALGVTAPEHLKVESLQDDLKDGTMILLCSDGLTEEVDDDQIAEILAYDLHPQEAVDHLILAALDNGGSDNITVVLLRFKKS